MRADEGPDDLDQLFDLVETLRKQLVTVEQVAKSAAADARSARSEVVRLRDEVAAAERDQQELRSARAKLARLSRPGLLRSLLRRSTPRF